MKTLFYFIAISLIITSCNNSKQETNLQTQNTERLTELQQLLVGKKGKITFPEMIAEVNYLNDSTLHWKTTSKEGIVVEGYEKMYYKKLTDNLHFLNWIEKDGWTVSQIIDTKAGTVKAFWSFADEKSQRGKRTSMFVDGKFEFIN
ncbi:MoaF-related domain-containing protein [Flavobacterium cheongpyeongense]|uniref:MoaF-related domain-containing protein n=1 Tax=Flavobacterium cheongpyeongense TaxID=2212651 RepID=UPI001E59ADB7|nr:hypothetical protein [Flavobacterium cheongpyeongense]